MSLITKMSVICQNFVQNAWKKDLCSNCFKSVGDHENVQGLQNGEKLTTSISEHLNGNCIPHVSSNVYTSRNESPPHTTWKTLISERNNKNSQPFKLENGFQGRLLTINKALNGTDKQPKAEIINDKPKRQINGITVKTLNGNVKKQASKPEIYQSKKNLSDEIKQNSNENCSINQNRTFSPLKKENVGSSECQSINTPDIIHAQPKSCKDNEEINQDVSLHSILKKSTSTPTDNGQTRRSSNVGFKDEEPQVIGYGGRDFSPEELEWEMASSDGEIENGSDSLDETEDDKVFSKMTKQNTEFNSDNANLLQCNEDEKTNSKMVSKQNKSQISKPNMDTKMSAINVGNKQKASLNYKSTTSETDLKTKTRYKNDKTNLTADAGVNNKQQREQHTCTVDKAKDDSCNNAKKTSEEEKVEQAPVDSKSANESSNSVTMSNEKKSEGVERSEAEVSGENVKNNSQFINEAASPPSAVDAPKIENEKSADTIMFFDGVGQEKSSEDACSEWQNEDSIPGQILQAINTSLTNRHKMRENSELCTVLENVDHSSSKENGFESETNKISLSVNNENSNSCDEIQGNSEMDEQSDNGLNVMPRDSFLHGTISKPSAIYGPASDFFVSRSDSSSSSSSDEQSKNQISLSINVRINGDDSQKSADELYSDNEENDDKECAINKINSSPTKKAKPEIPAKPVKPLLFDTHKQYDQNYSSKATFKDHSNFTEKSENISEISYYSSVPDRLTTTINLVDPYAESNIYQEVNEKDLEKIQDNEQLTKVPGRESRLAALAVELEQVRHTNISTKRQAPAPPKVPDPPQEDPPSCAGRISPPTDAPHSFSTFRGESMGFSSASSTTSTSSQDTETGYASWNLHGDVEDHPKYSKSKTSFLLTQYSKCKMLAMGYAEDGAKARKRFSIKKLLKIGKESEPPVAFDPNCPNPKAWKYSDHFERPRAKLEIIHPMDLENKSVTVNPGFDTLHSSNLTTFSPNNSNDDSSFRNSVTSVSSDYGSFYSDTLSPAQEAKQEASYEYIQPRHSITEGNEESCSKAETSCSTSPTPSRSSTASQASTVTSGSSKNGAVSHRPPKPPPPPRAHSLLPGNKVMRNSDGTFKIPQINGDTSSSDEVTVTLAKPQAPKRQCKSAIMRLDNKNSDEQRDMELHRDTTPSPHDSSPVFELSEQDAKQEENIKNTSSIQIIQNEHEVDNKQSDHSLNVSNEGVYDNLETSKDSSIQTSIMIKTGVSSQKEKISKSVLSRNKHPPLTKAPARPPPIYSKPQTGNFPKNIHPWKTLEDSYLALTSCNRELLIKLVNQALKKRKIKESKLSKLQFQWNDFEIDASQPSSVFAFGEKIAYDATMPQYPEYFLTLVVSIQHQSQLQEYTEIKYPMFGKFLDYIPGEFLDTSEEKELESMPATILVLDRSSILTIECFSENLPATLTEENEKELCFITLQLIQSLKSLQMQGIESIDTSCQNLLLVKTKNDKYYTLVFLYDICFEENDYSSDSCKISLCQYTLMLLFQMLKIQAIDDAALESKFSSNMSRKIFESAFSLLSEEKAVSLSQTKTLFECYLWGVTKVLESLQNSDDCDNILHRWLDIERSSCIKSIVNDESNDINIQNEYYSQFLIRTTVRNIREVASYL